MQISHETANRCVFGPFYPPTLQPSVDHAERLWGLVAVHELMPPSDAWAKAWVVGRSEEIARVASDILGSWSHGHTTDTEAAAALEGYLRVVHEGLAERLGAVCRMLPGACRRRRRAGGIDHARRDGRGRGRGGVKPALRAPPSRNNEHDAADE